MSFHLPVIDLWRYRHHVPSLPLDLSPNDTQVTLSNTTVQTCQTRGHTVLQFFHPFLITAIGSAAQRSALQNSSFRITYLCAAAQNRQTRDKDDRQPYRHATSLQHNELVLTVNVTVSWTRRITQSLLTTVSHCIQQHLVGELKVRSTPLLHVSEH